MSEHYHKDDKGILQKCYHHCRVIVSWQFWLGVTVSFPLEHFIWEKIPPFKWVTHWMGL